MTPEQLAAEISADPAGIGYPAWDHEPQTRKAIINALCGRREIPNPEPQEDITPPVEDDDLTAVLGNVSSASLVNLTDSPLLPYFFEVVKAGNDKSAKRLLQAAAKAGLLEPSEVQQVQDHFERLIPDPSYSPTILAPPRIVEVWGEMAIPQNTLEAALELL